MNIQEELSSQDYRKIDRDHVWHPLFQHQNLEQQQIGDDEPDRLQLLEEILVDVGAEYLQRVAKAQANFALGVQGALSEWEPRALPMHHPRQ